MPKLSRSYNSRKDPFSEDWFDDCFNALYEELCRYSLDFVPYLEIAEDIVQEQFIYLWDNRKRIDTQSSLKAYMYKAVKNKCLNYKKSFSFQNKENDPDLILRSSELLSINTTLEQLESKELESVLEKALDSLPWKTRVVFKLKRFSGLSHKTIAEKLFISIKATEYHIGKAMKVIVEYINNEYFVIVLVFLNFL